MKHLLRFSPLLAVLLLSACSASPAPSAGTLLDNPLYAAQFYSDMTDRLVTMQLRNEPMVKDPATLKIVDAQRATGVKKVQDALAIKQKGKMANFVSDTDDTKGTLLLVNGALYFGTDFWATPGANVHVYLSTGIDPRDNKTFPAATETDLGMLSNFYGAQSIALPSDTKPETVHSVVLYDPKIKWLLGFAQVH